MSKARRRFEVTKLQVMTRGDNNVIMRDREKERGEVNVQFLRSMEA